MWNKSRLQNLAMSFNINRLSQYLQANPLLFERKVRKFVFQLFSNLQKKSKVKEMTYFLKIILHTLRTNRYVCVIKNWVFIFRHFSIINILVFWKKAKQNEIQKVNFTKVKITQIKIHPNFADWAVEINFQIFKLNIYYHFRLLKN